MTMRRLLTSALCLLLLFRVAAAQSAGDYVIGAQDVLSIAVFDQTDLGGKYAVELDGSFTFPLVGRVKAGGMTIREFETDLKVRLADGFFKNPQITVAVEQYRSQRVFVTGEVLKPGPYALKVDRSLLALVSDLGGFTANAGHEIVVIRPPVGGGLPVLPLGGAAPEAPAPPADAADPAAPSAPPPAAGMTFDVPGAEVFRVSVIELQSGNPERNILLQAGDTVYVPRAAQVYISGSVARPGPIRFQEGMTLLQALTVAGGVTERGSQGRAKVLRTVEGKKQEVKIKLTDLVQPEDTIIVPERFF
jgi:polysaccharide export outer membrane protein